MFYIFKKQSKIFDKFLIFDIILLVLSIFAYAKENVMKKWKFCVYDLCGDASDEQIIIGQLAEQGWELTSVVALPLSRRAYFKRRANEKHEEFAGIIRGLIKGHSNRIHWDPAVERAKKFLKRFGLELAGIGDPQEKEPKQDNIEDTCEFPAVKNPSTEESSGSCAEY